MDQKQTFYDRFAGEFDAKMNRYDLETRVAVIYDQLLTEDLKGKRLLDAGCGTGWFSLRACERGAEVTSMDVGVNLLGKVAEKCDSRRVVGDICRLPFPEEAFDVVASSEVIEHVLEPRQAIAELSRVLKPGGVLALTTPNRIWHFAITFANQIGARPYQGYENWVGYRQLVEWCEAEGLKVESHFGFHLFPFVLSLFNPVLHFMDRFGKGLGGAMLNQAIRARKPD
jgi:2-polyprenyl-3-methyl-5-hydroxy-6-metoxy-1,4-benzoquinol methylase